MQYEWDEAKRQSNLAKHEFDFADAWRVYEADFKFTKSSPRGAEVREVDVAESAVDGALLTLVYTRRDDAVRVISMRRANPKEARLYAEAKNRSLYQ